MKTTIYYFSATGNSLSIGKKISQKLANCELIEISHALNKNAIINSEKVGFLFPVYAWGVPRIVSEFISKAQFKNTKYCFSICSCAGTACSTNLQIKKSLAAKNITLDAGFILKEPSNSIDFDDSNKMIKFIDSIRGNEPRLSIDVRLNEITQIISNAKSNNIEKDSKLSNVISAMLFKVAIQTFKTVDNNYFLTEGCNGCGICSKICKRNNIKMFNNKPVFQNNCENCSGCINACPSQVLQSSEKAIGQPRYIKKGIQLKELL